MVAPKVAYPRKGEGMGISSALNAGVMGLNVNASKLSTISDNIANSETKGYKRASVEFSSLVLTERVTSYDAGGVRATPVREVDNRGAILSTRNATDLAIGGSGFFPVTDVTEVNNGGALPLKLVTTGSFRPNAEGVLTTPTGFALLGWAADPDGTVTPPNREGTAGLAPVKIENLALAADPSTTIGLSLNLPANATAFGEPVQTLTLPVEYFDTLGGATTLTAQFTSQPAAVAGPDSNAWRLSFIDSATGPAPVFEADITFDDTPGNGGELLTVNQIAPAGPALYDPATGLIDMPVFSAQPLTINIGALGTTEGLQQLATDFTPINIAKTGSPASTLSGIAINDRGILEAIFDSGFRRTLFQIPVGMVQNPNGMRALDGQAFAITRESGPIFFYDAGDGPTGTVISSALEESTTDVAEELTQLIKTQRAYSSNAKIIQTVDEMLQETTNLKR